jgi:F-type H+-transporting ATPase subunit delta
VRPQRTRSPWGGAYLSPGFSALFVSFLGLLVDKRRTGLTAQILDEFDAIYCSLTETQTATVISAVKLENEQQFSIAKKLQAMTGAKNIKLKPVIDASILGGFIIKYGKDGSASVDLSVKGQMDAISASLQPVA